MMYALLIWGSTTGLTTSGTSPAFFPALFQTEELCEAQFNEIKKFSWGIGHACIKSLVDFQGDKK